MLATIDTYRVVFAGYYLSEMQRSGSEDGNLLVVIRVQAASREALRWNREIDLMG